LLSVAIICAVSISIEIPELSFPFPFLLIIQFLRRYKKEQ
jgi:hypothetical protein